MRDIDGSYTIEAAIILPLIFAVLLGLLYLSFYIHDAVWVQGVAYESAFMGANNGVLEDWRVTVPVRHKILEYLKERLENRQILSAATEYEVTEDGKQVTVLITGRRTVSASVSKPSGASYVRKMGKLIKMVQTLNEGE